MWVTASVRSFVMSQLAIASPFWFSTSLGTRPSCSLPRIRDSARVDVHVDLRSQDHQVVNIKKANVDAVPEWRCGSGVSSGTQRAQPKVEILQRVAVH